MPAGLVYVSDALMPGIRRSRGRHGFLYCLPDGSRLRDKEALERIRRLAIPPAYTDVWICPLPNGHLQATGRDARGRKQYRYHTEWNTQRNTDKFSRLEEFGEALPCIRRRVARDLAQDARTVTRRMVLATLIRLLDTTYIRVGNDIYAKQNRSYGLTTLQNQHVDLRGSTVRLSFRGKRGIHHEVSLDDRRVARIVRRCKQLPGQELFQYEDDGQVHRIGSGDVNDYLAEISGERFTAKDFRTWHGTVQALEMTWLFCAGSDGPPKNFIKQKVLTEVARRLGNTPAVCRKAYVHPAVLALGEQLANDSEAMAALAAFFGKLPSGSKGLYSAERRLLHFLKACRKRLDAAQRKALPPPGRKASRPPPALP